MKILFIQPPSNILANRRERKFAVPPIGLAMLAAVCEKEGHEIKIFDAMLEGYDIETFVRDDKFIRFGSSVEEIKKVIEDFKPDVVGIEHLQTYKTHEVNETIDTVKEVSPEIITIAGGPHPSAVPHISMKNKNLDYAMVGDSENSILQFLKALKDKSKLPEVDGLVWRENGEIIVNPKKYYLKDIDDLPFPAYHLMDIKGYGKLGIGIGVYKTRTYIPLLTSRGCPARCDFCPHTNVTGPKMRFRSLDSIIEEIKLLKSNYNVTEFQIIDYNFMANVPRVKEFCRRLVKENLNIYWSIPHGMQIKKFDEELVELFSSSGMDQFYLPIESCNQEFLKTDHFKGKDVALKKTMEVIKMGRKYNFKIAGFFQIGYVTETLQDMRNTIEFAKSLDIDRACFFISTPLPGTPYFEECKRKGLFIPDLDLSWLRYAKGNLITENFTPFHVEELRHRGWEEFELSRFRTVKHGVSVRQIEDGLPVIEKQRLNPTEEIYADCPTSCPI